MKFIKILFLTVLFLASNFLNAQELQIFLDKKLVKSYKSEDWKNKKLREGTPGKYLSKELFNIHRRKKDTYEGFSLEEVLVDALGKNWKKHKKIRFFAKDGVVKEAKLKDMTSGMKKHTGLIAIRNKGKDGLDLFVKGINTIYPGPFYLVWTGFGEEDYSGGAFKWPYHLSKIVLISK